MVAQAESSRLVLVQVLLRDFQMNPLISIYYYAPVCLHSLRSSAGMHQVDTAGLSRLPRRCAPLPRGRRTLFSSPEPWMADPAGKRLTVICSQRLGGGPDWGVGLHRADIERSAQGGHGRSSALYAPY
jgi:hypothetical protein